jgi:UDP-N-acetylglucosamine--N-acetylmuramyl-(pentapeptide) pyrophosphoryl-undecaprenol N-acetylglucosamine transferase
VSGPSSELPVFALITGGGTGGHVYPALALARALVARGHEPASIRFAGARRGLEARLVPEAGFAIELFPGRGLERRLSLANLRAAWESLVATVRALRLVRELNPRVVVGVGGYASLPCVVAARLLRIPTVVHDQNAAPGLANRIAVRLGARPAISVPGTPLVGGVVTGNPVRPEFAIVARAPSAPPLVAIFGGSLGARALNDAALGLYDRWRDDDRVAVHHVAGARNLESCRASLAAIRHGGDRLAYELVGYEDRMDLLLARSTVAVCRAGAGAIAELTATGVPAVLVPLPGSPGDHQTYNAEALAAAGAALLVPDAECDGARLDVELRELLADSSRLDAMGVAARAMGRVDAADRLADLVEEAGG